MGGRLGTLLVGEGHRVWGLRRNASALPEGLEPIAADFAAEGPLPELPASLDYVFFTAAAGRRDEATYRAVYVEGLRKLLQALESTSQTPKRLLFTSSTGVYGQRDGSWIDESSPTEPASFTGRLMLEAESLVATAPFPGINVRLAGIYGPGRNRLLTRIRDGEPVQKEPPLYTNRIHRDDCAGLLRHLMLHPDPEPVYIGVDSEPASQHTVALWLRQTMGLGAPPTLPTGESSRRPSKRCRNARLLASGYRLLYPTFREGYGEMLRNEVLS